MGNRKWTPKEDSALITALCELCNAGWKRENGSFKSGYTAALEKKIKSMLPGCNIKASPHIESRLKVLKKHYDAVTELQGADGIEWVRSAKVLTCEDDDVWENWIRTHNDAKGLRNKQFPHYDELHLFFGNRGSRKCVKEVVEEEDENFDLLMVPDSLEGDDKVDKEVEVTDKRNALTIVRTDNHIDLYGKSKPRDMPHFSILPDHEEGANDQDDDSTGTDGSDENILEDTITKNEEKPCVSNMRGLKRRRSLKGNHGSSETEQLAKIFGGFLDKYQEHLSLLGEIVKGGKDAEKIAEEKRTKLNGELKKLPNLNLQARLRAASVIVVDPAKLDLFYSLSKEERREWVSMLLTGLI